MPITPLHLALGELDSPLDFDLVSRACQNRITERTSLDWKLVLPLTADEAAAKREQQAELAKDIAAMANSGGGMVVYGVAEASGDTSAAGSVQPVGVVTESTKQQIRQVAGNLIYPPVAGLELLSIAPPHDPAAGVLVMVIPDSPEVPHLIHPRGKAEWFAAPWRDGAHTTWMVERQLDVAYRQREIGRRQRDADLDEFYASFARRCASAPGTWVVAVAHPQVPHRRYRELTQPRTDRILRDAASVKAGDFTGAIEEVAAVPTRRGLRSFNRTLTRNVSHPRGARLGARIEVQGSGAVAVGFGRGGAFYGDLAVNDQQVSVSDFDQAGIDLALLVIATARELQLTCDFVARMGVYPPTQLFRRPDPMPGGLFQPFNEEHRVHDFRAVDGPILAGTGVEATFASMIDVVRDAVNQCDWETGLSASDLSTLWQLEH